MLHQTQTGITHMLNFFCSASDVTGFESCNRNLLSITVYVSLQPHELLKRIAAGVQIHRSLSTARNVGHFIANKHVVGGVYSFFCCVQNDGAAPDVLINIQRPALHTGDRLVHTADIQDGRS